MNVSVCSVGQVHLMVYSRPENLRVQLQLTRLSGPVWEQVLLNQKSKHFPFLNQENNVCTKICTMNYPVTNTQECPETNHYNEENSVCCYLFDLMTTSNSRVIAVNPYFNVCLQAAHAFPRSTGVGNNSSCSQLCCLLALSLQAKGMTVHLPPCHKISFFVFKTCIYPPAAFWIMRYPVENVSGWRIFFHPVSDVRKFYLRGLHRHVTLWLCSSGSAASSAKGGQFLAVFRVCGFHFENIKHLQSHQLYTSLHFPKQEYPAMGPFLLLPPIWPVSSLQRNLVPLTQNRSSEQVC